MKCTKCGFQQDEGKFCGKCGGELLPVSKIDSMEEVAASAEASMNNSQPPVTPATSEPNATNDSLERVKETSRAYGGFFVNYLKHPSQVFTRKSSELTNALISIGLAVLLTILTYNVLISNAFGDYSYGPSFVSVFSNTLIGMAILLAIIITLLFLINKMFGTDGTYTDIVSIFGAHMTPVIIVSAAAFLLAILKSNMFATMLMMIVLMLIIFVIPLYLISSLLTRRSKGIDPLYGYVLYIVATFITLSIVMVILADSALGNMVEILDDFMYYM